MKLTRKTYRSRRSQHILIGTVLLALGFAWVASAAPDGDQPTGEVRLVTLHDRGKKHVILTHATIVRDAVRDAHITLAPEDVTEPALDSKLTATDSSVNVYHARPVIIVDGAAREKIMTPGQTADKILADADLPVLGKDDKTTFTETDSIVASGATVILTVKRAAPPTPAQTPGFKPGPMALTRAKSAQMFTDSKGVTHRETYYDLPMNVVIRACGPGDYTIRYDGAKVDKDGYVLVAANYKIYPKCSVVETSMGPGKIYDTGGFVLRHPVGFDLATDWTNYDGR